MTEKLEVLRENIISIDEELVHLLNRRAELSLKVGILKKDLAMPVYDPSQESNVLCHASKSNSGPLSDSNLRSIFTEILSGSRELQSPLAVAYLGPETSFSHLAAQSHFGKSTLFVSQTSILDVFNETENGAVHLGIVPVENSLEGPVKVTLDRLMCSSLSILGEIYLPIRHTLMSRSNDRSAIVRVYSHPQALAQCQTWLNHHMGHCSFHETESTARAAEKVSEDPLSAAIGSSLAAAKYGLSVIAEGIEDHSSNMTRFLVIGRGVTKPTGRDKTSLFFGVRHKPGALYQSLRPFSERNINLMKIVSHPIRERMWEYLFFVDFIGHTSDENIADCLESLSEECTMVRILGSYPMGDHQS